MTDTNKTPNCDMREALVSYLYSEATTEESREVEAHLRGCSSCKQELDGFERVRASLQQWQLDDMPVVRVVSAPPRRPAIAVLKELISVLPLWSKAAGAIAMAVFVFAVMGIEINIGRNGFSMRADLLRRNQVTHRDAGDSQVAVASASDAQIEQVRAEVRSLVNAMIVESERERRDELRAQLVSFESQLQNLRSADLARLAARIQEHQSKIRTLERDIDRREGSDLTDILFSDLVNKPGGVKTAAKSDSD
jgi:Putative zinc-finger